MHPYCTVASIRQFYFNVCHVQYKCSVHRDCCCELLHTANTLTACCVDQTWVTYRIVCCHRDKYVGVFLKTLKISKMQIILEYWWTRRLYALFISFRLQQAMATDSLYKCQLLYLIQVCWSHICILKIILTWHVAVPKSSFNSCAAGVD